MLLRAMTSENLEGSLKVIAETIVSQFPDSKIWFTKSFGKRREYITGAGKETFASTERLEYAKNYTAFLQNLSNLTTGEKNALTGLLNLVTIIQETP